MSGIDQDLLQLVSDRTKIVIDRYSKNFEYKNIGSAWLAILTNRWWQKKEMTKH